MEFASYGQVLTPSPKKKEFTNGCIHMPQAFYQSRPKGTASIYNF
jgi:hypothetical protein